MKKGFKLLSIGLAVATAFSVTACGGDNGKKENEIRIYTYSGNEFDGVTMDSVFKKIEEEIGVTLSFEGATSEDYYNQLTPMMGSLDCPDIFWSDPDNSNGAFQNWADPKQDILWNLDELLLPNQSRYPYLNKLVYSNQYKNIMYFDGHYIVPAVETPTAWAIYYRADWLKAIGFVDANGNAKAPVTLDEFEEVMSKFSGTDLFTDANGKKSGTTYGISPNTSNFYVNPLYGAFGITPDWDITESGDVSYMYTRESFKPYLEWMNAMYKKGYIDPSFNENIGFTDRNLWYEGKVGCIMTNGESHMEWVVGNFESSNGTDKVIVGPAPVGTGNVSKLTGKVLGVKGESGFSNWGGYYGGYAVTKETKDVYKTLDLLEYLVSPEGSKLRLYGIEGKHYTVDDEGNIVADIEGRNSERSNFFASVTDVDGNSVNAGLHKIGGRFGYNVDWDEYEKTGGDIIIATDIGSLYPKYRELVNAARNYTNKLQTPKLLNVTSFPSSVYKLKADVQIISASFINKAIIGQNNLTTDWNEMMGLIEKAGYSTVKSVMKETAQNLGII